MSEDDILGSDLRRLIYSAEYFWDVFKISDAIRRGEATRQEVIDYIKRFERENPKVLMPASDPIDDHQA